MTTDHFGKLASIYADHRPAYPHALFSWLASQCEHHQLAWDCGAGSGQASVALAQHFDKVHATDMSADQLRHAKQHQSVAYHVALAEASGLPDRSADLITVAQALHWFDLDRFYAEARRVLKPGAIIAAWSYGQIAIDHNEADKTVQHFYHHVIGPYWPAERHHVETGYRDLPFPFEPVDTPALAMEASWTLAQLLGYLRSWSACARYKAATGRDPVDDLAMQLRSCWTAESRHQVRWPLTLLAGR